MFKKIMVPLDGSKLAEIALPYAETLAKSCKVSEVVLVSVTEKVKGVANSAELREALRGSDKAELGESSSGIVPQMVLPATGSLLSTGQGHVYEASRGTTVSFGKMEGQAERYLARIAKKLKTKGIPVKSEVLIGNPAEQITKYAEDQDIELIVMASHGRSGPSRWAMGSVTDKVFRATCVPILMIRAPGCVAGV
jgi:nucleotide-binding universal stress UspA family protein